MRNEPCPQEERIVHAVRAGQRLDSLTQHLEECAACREIAQVTQWMGELAEEMETSPAAPEPSVLWRSAQMVDGQADRDRLLWPLSLIWFVVQGGLALALATWFLRSWPEILAPAGAALLRLLPEGVGAIPDSGSQVAAWLILAGIGLLVYWTLYPTWTED